MPAKLKVLRSGSVVEEFDITKPAILIGKGAHCDLILNFPGVGREMARLTAEKDGFYLNDVSLLGVFVSGRRITRQRIEPGQEILCGSVKMSLIDEPPVQAPVSGGYTSARELWETARSKEPQPACLVSRENPADAHVISNDEYTIGRNPEECRLVLNDKSVSKCHARITRNGDRFMLADLNSSSGTFVNGKKLSGSIELKAGDEVKIEKSVFIFQKQSEEDPQSRPLNMQGVGIPNQSPENVRDFSYDDPPQASLAFAKSRKGTIIFALVAVILIVILVTVAIVVIRGR